MATCEECKFFHPCDPDTCWAYTGTCGHCHVAPPRNMVVRLGKLGTYSAKWRCGWPHLEGASPECAEFKR